MKQILFYFSVKGQFHFPTDMLRYDRCWPAEQSALDDGFNEQRTIKLIGINSPTIARWQSFGWRVSEIKCSNCNVRLKIAK